MPPRYDPLGMDRPATHDYPMEQNAFLNWLDLLPSNTHDQHIPDCMYDSTCTCQERLAPYTCQATGNINCTCPECIPPDSTRARIRAWIETNM
jgi:hypothetical protein